MSGDHLSTSALQRAIFGRSSELNRITRHNPEGYIVPQRVHRDALVDVRGLRGGMNGAVELPRAERIDRIEARKQPAALQHPALRMRHAPPDTQTLK